MPETTSNFGGSRRFEYLRGVQWRIGLGILPVAASIDDLRRVTADSRRRYASLRRQLLIDPHLSKDGIGPPDLVIDNPLSQNPDSIWGRFFKNAELERMLDLDLTRLYPERSSYFQTSGCQGMLRRILLLWCLRHPEYGYGQGMHELLAPLLYVLHMDVEHLVKVRKLYEDHFTDKFDGFLFNENDFTHKFDSKKSSGLVEDKIGCKTSLKAPGHCEINPEIQSIVCLSDSYGAEGELGIVLSENFMEHDAYSMFDALMRGAGGAVEMARFFSPSPFVNSHSGVPPIIEASAALHHLLSIVDSSLHSHLVELGVEPQYFALRWLRVLFGREFSLEDLLVIWDEIFSRENTKLNRTSGSDKESNFRVLDSLRGAFISAFAVSMILNLRSVLLATENATACLQRLLKFPVEVNLVKLITKAASLQALAIDSNANFHQIQHGSYLGTKSTVARGHSLSLDLTSPITPLNMVHESYWEEKWRVLHKEEGSKKGVSEKQSLSSKKGWSDRVRLRLSRTESDPSPSMKHDKIKDSKPSVRRNLLDDLAKQLGSDEDKESVGVDENKESVGCGEDKEPVRGDEDIGSNNPAEANGQNLAAKNFSNTLRGVGSEGNSPNMTEPRDLMHGNSNQEDDLESSIASNSSIDENDSENNNTGSCGTNPMCSPLPGSYPPAHSPIFAQHDYSIGKSTAGVNPTKLLSGKFQWLWKFGRHASDITSERACAADDSKTSTSDSCCKEKDAGFSMGDRRDGLCGTSKQDTVNRNMMVSLRSLGHSMLENIQVIDDVFRRDLDQIGSSENLKNHHSVEGHSTAMAALDELRKISNLLSEM